MMKQLLQLFLISLLPVFSISQTADEKKEITKDYNLPFFEKLAQVYKSDAETRKNRSIELALQNGWDIRKEEDGVTYELMEVSAEGNPIYYITNNVDAAESTRANTLHNGGILGLNVEGQNMTAHVWDAGLARGTHQEYDGPGGNNRFSIGDGTTALHYHSAHVTGTIIASGFVANAKGMAPQAYAIGYEWNNDASEATTAAGSGMLISNHSYGWVAADIPDWWFGAYLNRSREWDVIMHNAPYYLMVCSAGNDGNNSTANGNPLDGNSGYDKLSGFKTSKNNMVVANGQDANIDANGNLISVTINSGSSQGPTDDYRIKPDITGNGTGVYSTYENADNAYSSISGTSMAAPNVAGTLLLLQKHYHNLNSNYMRAATLKGLALHTADEAGPAGPDVVYGWGLMNAKAAANVISANGTGTSIQELTLNQGGTFSMSVTSDGLNPLVASISWTDPPGTINTGTANDNTPVLVNDLDIRITKGATTYYPYRLTSITTNGTGDNLVDPYEKTIINGATGAYTITVSHKGSLSGGSQAFSLIVTGRATSIPPVADFSANSTTPALGQTVQFNDMSSNTPTSWSWSFSPNTITYVGGTASTSQNPQIQFNAFGLYSVSLTVTNAYGTDSQIKTNYINVVPYSYCIPTYSTGTSTGDYISLVQLGSINNATGALPSPYYFYYNSLSTDLVPGNAHSVTVSAGTYGSGNNISVWIDFNQNGVFEVSEKLGNVTLGAMPQTGIINFTVPVGATPGITRMRVREVWNNSNFDPCTSYTYGETEDYNVNILHPDISLDLTVFMEGPFSGNQMNANLGNLIPLTQPYNISPWNYTGTESVATIPANIVDWVLVELRDAASAATATSASMVDRQAAFLLTDGSVVGIDGLSNLTFPNSITQQLYVVIRHRNHLGVMSANALTPSGGIHTYDFTTGSATVHGGSNGHKQLLTGVWGMISGDGNRDGQVGTGDKSGMWDSEAGTAGYIFSDYNFDRQSNNIDKDEYWVPNLGKGSQVPN